MGQCSAAGRGELLEVKMLGYFRDEVESLMQLSEDHGVTMTDSTFFSLFERMFNMTQVPANGTPLRGLQIMGVLETRSLDFDNVVILSMNEKVFPKKQYVRTMIPNNLRRAYSLPDFESKESDYAYCFYRLLGRARRVKLLYDSRTGSFGAGEMSRYISQVRYLMPETSIRFSNLALSADYSENPPIVVRKADVLRELEGLKGGGRLYLSASALKTYKKCPLQFYLQYVRNMRGSDELVDYISASDFGTIVHNSIEKLYEPYAGRSIDGELIDSWLRADNPLIRSIIDDMIYEQSYKSYVRGGSRHELPVEGILNGNAIEYNVRIMLGFERDAFCRPSFVFRKAEETYKGPWKIDDDLSVNFRMSIDRVDVTGPGRLRFIDFKTGTDSTRASDVSRLFSSSHDGDAIFQLLTYCEAYSAMVDPEAEIQPVIYPLGVLASRGAIEPVSIGGSDIMSYKQVSGDFLPMLRGMVREIFDPGKDFVQAESDDDCVFCPFMSMCGRTPSSSGS